MVDIERVRSLLRRLSGDLSDLRAEDPGTYDFVRAIEELLGDQA